jgi:hypothetical protein
METPARRRLGWGPGYRALPSGKCDEAPPLRKMTILSGPKNQHTDIGRRLWRTGNTIEARPPPPGLASSAAFRVRRSHQRREAIERLDAGAAVMDVARSFGVDRATLYRLKAEAVR